MENFVDKEIAWYNLENDDIAIQRIIPGGEYIILDELFFDGNSSPLERGLWVRLGEV